MASHLTLRTRQGRHDLLALGARFPVSLCPFRGSLPEVFIEGEERRLLQPAVAWESGLRWQREGVFDIVAWKAQPGSEFVYSRVSYAFC